MFIFGYRQLKFKHNSPFFVSASGEIRVKQRLESIEVRSQLLSSALWSLDQKRLKTYFAGILNLPDIVHLHLKIYPDNDIKMGELPKNSNIKSLTIDLKYRSGQLYDLGFVTITAGTDAIYKRVWDGFLLAFMPQVVKTFFLSIFFVWIFQQFVIRRLENKSPTSELANSRGSS